MPELTDDHYVMLSHFNTHGGTLTYQSIIESPPTGRLWDKHDVGRLLRELCDVGLLERKEMAIHTITEKGIIAYKINIILPDVYKFLSTKRFDDFFYWGELKEKANITDDIEEILLSKLYHDNYIKKSIIKGSEENGDFLEVTQRFKLVYSGLEEKKSSTATDNSIHIHGNENKIATSGAIQDSFLDTRPTLYPSQNMKQEDKKTNQTPGSLMKLWTFISENKLISTILAGLIIAAIYYFLFGIRPKVG